MPKLVYHVNVAAFEDRPIEFGLTYSDGMQATRVYEGLHKEWNEARALIASGQGDKIEPITRVSDEVRVTFLPSSIRFICLVKQWVTEPGEVPGAPPGVKVEGAPGGKPI